jgi:hypothetical protein
MRAGKDDPGIPNDSTAARTDITRVGSLGCHDEAGEVIGIFTVEAAAGADGRRGIGLGREGGTEQEEPYE